MPPTAQNAKPSKVCSIKSTGKSSLRDLSQKSSGRACLISPTSVPYIGHSRPKSGLSRSWADDSRWPASPLNKPKPTQRIVLAAHFGGQTPNSCSSEFGVCPPNPHASSEIDSGVERDRPVSRRRLKTGKHKVAGFV